MTVDIRSMRRRRAKRRRRLAELILGQMGHRRISRGAMARRVGYDRSVISRALSGRSQPTWPVLIAMIGALDGARIGPRQLWHEQAQDLWREVDDFTRRIHRARAAARWEGGPPGGLHEHADLLVALAALLQKRSVSRREVARHSGWSPSAVSAALRGDRGLPQELMIAIVRACGEDEQAVNLWLERWVALTAPELRERRRRRWRGYQRRWYAQQADAS
ncbi:helix-turn-helix transcriptional regulator [Streptomyces sp. NPDC050610]|uniref:helix-turn-helix domain-containing protein n=1 Tax=Streptomyces sp. NPDC050610 TaxID=3157097 RepID=UPI00342C25FF